MVSGLVMVLGGSVMSAVGGRENEKKRHKDCSEGALRVGVA